MFCKSVWNGIYIINDGYIRLCSIGTNTRPELDMQRARDKHGNIMHILTHEISEIMNSDKHCEVRKTNIDNPTAWSPHCSCCENREKITDFDPTHSNTSRRQYLMKIENDDVVNVNNFSTKSIDGKVSWMPNSLDIRFGNLCNQKCIMCGPNASNQWYDEFVEYNQTTKFGNGEKIEIVKDAKTNKWIEPEYLSWYENPIWWRKFKEMMPYLKHLYITGGEPMIVPAHDEMLDLLIESDLAKDIWLEYDTNASAINDKIVERWSKFKRVDIRVSMDGIHDEYELIRFGGKWEKFEKNISILRNYSKLTNNKIRVTAATSCFQISNAYGIIKSEEWCKSVGVPFHLRFLEGPSRHAVASLGDDAKLKLLEYYKEFKETSEKARLIIKHLESHIGPQYRKDWAIKDYIKFMDYLDSTRKTSWRSILPQVSSLIEFDQTDNL